MNIRTRGSRLFWRIGVAKVSETITLMFEDVQYRVPVYVNQIKQWSSKVPWSELHFLSTKCITKCQILSFLASGS